MASPDAPISIIVLTYNQLKYTKQCFEHLFSNTDNFQLIVVDNASSDGTREYLLGLERSHKNVKVILNKSNRGYAGGCNLGVARAKHGLVCLLNNDTIPLPGWLDALRADFEEGVGIVGSKLVWPNLQVQHAGIEFVPRDQPTPHFMPVHRYSGAPSSFPGTNERAVVAGVTAACLLTSRSVWQKVGGLDEGFIIGNYEDVDFNLKVRDAGYSVIYEPESCLVHYGNVSFVDVNPGVMEQNFSRLHHRWFSKLCGGLWSAETEQQSYA